MEKITALALYSGGLDSILACRLIMAQSIRVRALKFVSPFFDYDLLDHPERYCQKVRDKYGIEVELVDISSEYIELLRNPAHGFGRYFNPCIDCKILMLQKAAALMPKYNARFIITGEVLGQRPMSQRRDTLRIIERDSGCAEYLLRPLCAGLLPPTLAERQGLVDRHQLASFSGRGRQPQIELAEKFGITDYPNPAGGCILADPNLSQRIRKLYAGEFPVACTDINTLDIRFLLFGRHFLLSPKSWFILGRNERENKKIGVLSRDEDLLFSMKQRPGPTGVLRGGAALVSDVQQQEEIFRLAAGLVVRYGKKVRGERPPAQVEIHAGSKLVSSFEIGPPAEELLRAMTV